MEKSSADNIRLIENDDKIISSETPNMAHVRVISIRNFIVGLVITVFLVVYLYITFPKYDFQNDDDTPFGLSGRFRKFRGEILPEETIQQYLKRRLDRVDNVCRKYNLGKYNTDNAKPAFRDPPTPAYSIWYFDLLHRVAYVPLYKAASSSWLYNLALLAGMTPDEIHSSKQQISVIARNVIPELSIEDAIKALRTSFKFIIVRHPFERLLSAYRDKLENINVGREHGVEHFYQKYGKKIVAKYRNVSETRQPYDNTLQDPNLPSPSGIEPTFAEFIRYLNHIDVVEYSDDHWIPYYLHCTPCLIEYDFIATFETLSQDQYYIIDKANISHIIKPTWRHLTKGKKTKDVVRKYFSTISYNELMELYKKYKLDFELFGYDIEEYLSYVKK